ncbi:MAG: hypothetical protein RMA76_45050 [Deltaproteobacteria bacterium]|jgi:hypothetical protein
MRPGGKKDEERAMMSSQQLEITKAAIEATAQVTAAMVSVTNEKNPAKISEAYRVIYKTVMDVVKGQQKKGPGV